MQNFMRGLWRSVRGGRRPSVVAAGIVLGASAGAVCGANLTFAALVLALLMLNTSLLAVALAAAAGASIHLAGDSLVQSLGSFLLNKAGFGIVVESLGHGVAAGLSGWSDYQLVGAATAALLGSLPAAHAAARRCTSDALDSTSSRDSLWRPHGWLPAGAWIAAVVVLPYSLASYRACESVLAHLSAAADAPVRAGKATYELWSGRLRFEDLTIDGLVDAARPTLRIERLDAQLDPGLLVRGRLHCESAVLVGLHCDAAAAVAPPSRLFPNEPTFLREGGAAVRDLPPSQPIDVDEFLHDWSATQKNLGVAARLIEAVECVSDCEEARSVVADRFAALRRPGLLPCDPLSGRPEPLVQIRKLRVEPLPTKWGFGPQAKFELTNLSSRPSVAARTAQVIVDDPTRDLQMTLDFRLATADRKHELVVAGRRSLGSSLFDARRLNEAGFDVATAQMTTLRGRGWATRDRLELPLMCEVHGVRLTSGSGRFGGVDFAVWRESLTRLGGLRFESSLNGRWSAPHVQVVPLSLVEQMKHQLRSAGEHTLVGAVTAGRLSAMSPPSPIVPAVSTSTMPQVPASNTSVTTPHVVVSPPSAVAAAVPAATPSAPAKPIASEAATAVVPSGSSPNLAATPQANAAANTALVPPVASPTVPRPEPTATSASVAPATPASAPIVVPPSAAVAAPPATPVTQEPAATNPTVPTPSPVAAANATATTSGAATSVATASHVVTPSVAPAAPAVTVELPSAASAAPSVAATPPTSADTVAAGPSNASAFDRVAGDVSAALQEAESKKLPPTTKPQAAVAVGSNPSTPSVPNVARSSKVKIPEPPVGKTSLPPQAVATPQEIVELKPIAAGIVLRQPEGIANPKSASREPAAVAAAVVAPPAAVVVAPAAPTYREPAGRGPTDREPARSPSPAVVPNDIAQTPPPAIVRSPLPQTPSDSSYRDLAARPDVNPPAAEPVESKRPLLGRITGWFAEEETPRPSIDSYRPKNELSHSERSPPADLAVTPRGPNTAASPSPSSKPWFPRVRSFFTGDTLPDAGPSSNVYSDETIASDSARPSTFGRKNTVPETAREPQTGRTIR